MVKVYLAGCGLIGIHFLSVLTLPVNPMKCHACYTILKPLYFFLYNYNSLKSFSPYIQWARRRPVASNEADEVTFFGIPFFVC